MALKTLRAAKGKAASAAATAVLDQIHDQLLRRRGIDPSPWLATLGSGSRDGLFDELRGGEDGVDPGGVSAISSGR
jgi:hypothetical protein